MPLQQEQGPLMACVCGCWMAHILTCAGLAARHSISPSQIVEWKFIDVKRTPFLTWRGALLSHERAVPAAYLSPQCEVKRLCAATPFASCKTARISRCR